MTGGTSAMTPCRGLPILAYHSISDGPPPLCISPGRFDAHLASLHDAGWATLTLDQLLEGHARGGWPARRLMLTFDDGLVSFAREAMPRLTRFGFAATLFVVAGRLGGHADWPGWQTMAPVERLLDRPALVEIASVGVEIGAHAVTHQRLSSLLPDVAAREVLDSRARLEDALGRPVRSFAYPYGDAPISIARLVREQFAAGFGIRLAWASPASRLETIERIDAYYLRKRASLALLDGWPSRAVLSVRSGLRALRRASGYGS